MKTVISSQATSAMEANARIDVNTSPSASDYHTFPFLPRFFPRSVVSMQKLAHNIRTTYWRSLTNTNWSYRQ